MSIERLQSGPRMSQAVIHNGVVYLAGQVAKDPSKDLADQTGQVLASIDSLLAEAGSDRSRILSATIYLTDMADFATMNEVWEGWVVAGSTPARATVEAGLASSKYKIEIVVVAAAS
ncbi:MAG TPA: RidA family protein [Reyranella sp.]|nr:RidA family protein [Reyranella sp.]